MGKKDNRRNDVCSDPFSRHKKTVYKSLVNEVSDDVIDKCRGTVTKGMTLCSNCVGWIRKKDEEYFKESEPTIRPPQEQWTLSSSASSSSPNQASEASTSTGQMTEELELDASTSAASCTLEKVLPLLDVSPVRKGKRVVGA